MKAWFTKLFNEKVLLPLIDKIVMSLSKWRAKLNGFTDPEVQVRRAENVTDDVVRHTRPGGPRRG